MSNVILPITRKQRCGVPSHKGTAQANHTVSPTHGNGSIGEVALVIELICILIAYWHRVRGHAEADATRTRLCATLTSSR